MRRRRKWSRKAAIGLSAGFLLLGLAFTLWLRFSVGITSLNPFAAEVDSLYQESRSPDGQFTAKLLYRENLAMTYGFYHVSIKANNSTEYDPDVIEVAAEGLSKLAWKDSQTLVISYDVSKSKDRGESAEFVKKPTAWRSIRIEYQPVTQSGN